VSRRRAAYARGRRAIKRLPVPVLVVGNIVVGGAGKTPAVLAVVDALKRLGHRPAIVSRGYGATEHHPRLVTSVSSASEVGDEPLLLYLQSQVPVAVGVDRSAAGRHLLRAHPEIDCIVCDDGLQHYGLHRDIELAVIARDKGLGNGALLPAGPLREPMERLSQVDAIVWHGEQQQAQAGQLPALIALLDQAALPQFVLQLSMAAPVPFQEWKAKLFNPSLQGDAARNLNQDALLEREARPTVEAHALAAGSEQAWSVWQGNRVHAVAGIAHPQRFFHALTQHGMQVVAHPFSDHHCFAEDELTFPEPYPIMMTEKDAVKCLDLNLDCHWVVSLHAQLETGAIAWLHSKLES